MPSKTSIVDRREPSLEEENRLLREENSALKTRLHSLFEMNAAVKISSEWLEEQNQQLEREIAELRGAMKPKALVDAKMTGNISQALDCAEQLTLAKRQIETLEKSLYGAPPVPKDNNQIKVCISQLDAMGNTDRHIFPQKLIHVVRAISQKELIDQVDIANKVKDPDFRFFTKDQPTLSLELSSLLAENAKSLRKAPVQFMASGTKKRSENADDYARQMFDEVLMVQAETGVSSYRKVADELTVRNLPTPNGGKWSPGTVLDLEKRWIKLGLMPEKKRQPK